MRVLFLDIDGVLHSAKAGTPESQLFCWFDELVCLLAPHPDVMLVVHSTWRLDHTAAELGDLLGVLASRYLGVTPRGPRWESIRWWLYQNKAVTSFRILDDQPREFVDPVPVELIVCHPETGLSAPEVRAQVRDWLETT